MRSLLLISLVALAGCTQSTTQYPSLLPRSVEGQSLAEPERTPAVAAADPALDARIAELRASLDKASGDFNKAAQDAEARIAVARGVPAGSEAWLNAQTALSGMDRLRAAIVTVQADIDALVIERGRAGLPDYPALHALAAAADETSTAQGDRILALEAALAGA